MGILNEAHVTNFLKSGQLKALAVTSPQRLSTYPQVPTMSEVGLPRCVIVGYYGISTAAGLPKPILDQLAEGFKKILADPPVAKNLVQNGIYPDYLGPEEYGKFVVEESKRYGEIAQKAKISLP
jgi:tripartite-type tricarboxylate transporter receptor subunit TctC